MSQTELTLSFALWLCVGFVIGYRYHVLKVRDIVARRSRRMASEIAVDLIKRDPDEVLSERILRTPCHGRAAPLLSLSEFPPEDRRLLEDARN